MIEPTAADQNPPRPPRWTDLIGLDPDYLKDASYLRLTPAEDDISWAGLMELLDEHWPADLFPTLVDDPERDAGARIVSLLRWVDRLRADAPSVEAKAAAQFLAWMSEQAKHAPITYGVPEPHNCALEDPECDGTYCAKIPIVDNPKASRLERLFAWLRWATS